MWCEAVRTATAWLLVFYFFLLFLMCHYAVMLSLGLEKVCPRSRPQPQRGYFLLVVLWIPSLYLYRFLEMGPRHIAIS